MIKPLNSHLVIRPHTAASNEEDGIFIPMTDEGGVYRAEVLAKCDTIDIVEVGDTVIVSRYVGTSITLDGEPFKMIQASQLMAKE